MTNHRRIRVELIEESSEFLMRLLPIPGKLSWPENDDAFSATLQKCRETLQQEYWPLLDLSILTASLLNKDSWYPTKSPLVDLFAKFLPGLSPDEIMQVSWRPVPVLGTQPMGEKEAKITWFIIGHLEISAPTSWSCCPEWASKLIDDNAQAALDNAISAAQYLTGKPELIHLFPLINQNSGQEKLIEGRSLGLPIAIAATSLLTGSDNLTHFIATGDILGKEGQTGSVNNQTLALKAEKAAEAGYSLFLYPQDNAASFPNQIENLYLKPVASLKQAKLWAECYTSPTIVHDVQRLSTALQSCTDLVNNIDNLLPVHLEWLHDTGEAGNLIKKICCSPGLSWQLAEKLKVRLRNTKESVRIPTLVASLICAANQIDTMGEANLNAAFSWCSSHLDLANHFGDNAKSRYWWSMGNRFSEKACETEEGRRIFQEFSNRFLGVGKLHNTYHFEPTLPKKFNDYLKELEEEHQVRCKSRKVSNYLLGSMYGTVGQNYAFCGPKFLDQTVHYLTAAQKAFGPADTKNCQQEDSYLFFAYLDAGPSYASKASEKLCAAIDIASIEDIHYDQLKSKFKYFALVRALVDIPEQFTKNTYAYLSSHAYSHFTNIIAEIERTGIHPWQLWTYNLGRLAMTDNNQAFAKQAWQKSYTLCMQGGETIKIMALLPLAALKKNNDSSSVIDQQAEEIFELIRESNKIHQPHFKQLLNQKSTAEALHLVADNPGKFFPFNYR